MHAPGTKLSNGFGEANEATLNSYVNALQESEVQFFGITDYFSFDSYLAVVEAYQRVFPEGEKVFIPNIEFRLTETISPDARYVHTHVLFDPTPSNITNIHRMMSDLETHLTRESRKVRCNELTSQRDFEQATVGFTELREVLATVFPDPTNYIIVTAANNDGLRGVDITSPRSISFLKEIDNASDALFGSSKNTAYFLLENRYKDDSSFKRKPVFSGSDAHSFNDLKRLSGDEVGFEATWIKADLTFRGLQQTLFEPEERVHIGEYPVVLTRQKQDATRFISEVRIDQVPTYSGGNGSWFKGVVIPFNPELTAIIGNKGSGKSAIADILGLLGESRQFKHFSFLTDRSKNRKFRQKGYAENFCATLSWASGVESMKGLNHDVDLFKPETVKYLPQNYFESLTNEIEVKAFRREIEEVVFSHVEEFERMGKSSFSELEELKTAQSKADIATLTARLHQLNVEIVDFEYHANPATINAWNEQLRQRREEYRVLDSSAPAIVPEPQGETEDQKRISDQINNVRNDIALIELRGKEAVDRLSLLKSDLVSLNTIKESISAIGSKIIETKENIREACARFDLNFDAIVIHQFNTKSIDEIVTRTSVEIEELETDNNQPVQDATNFQSLTGLPNLRRAHRFLSDKLKALQETLSAPQRRYQRYVQTMTDLTANKLAVMGEKINPKPGTINHIEGIIHYINGDLKKELNEKYIDRDNVARSIFQAKKKVIAFYAGLKSSVDERLATVRSSQFDVTIDASFVPSHEFPDRFFELVNQVSSGPFRGTTFGAAVLEERMAETDWNDAESILSFVNGIINAIKTEDVDKQVKDIKRFYDLLFSFEYFDSRYELRLGGKNLNQLSPGEKGMLLLVFYLHLDMEKTPLIIDQPEDNLDNESIFSVLAKCMRQAKKTRQVILITHNPNLAVGADAEQVIYVSLDKAKGYKFSYETGSIECPRINDLIVKILEGSKPAFVQRRLKYQIN